MKQAIKKDVGKPHMHLLPPEALLSIARVMTFGIGKYSEYNYRNGDGLKWTRVADALQRHLQQWLGGEDLDPETGENHMVHAGGCVIMLLDLIQRNKSKGDDRPKYD